MGAARISNLLINLSTNGIYNLETELPRSPDERDPPEADKSTLRSDKLRGIKRKRYLRPKGRGMKPLPALSASGEFNRTLPCIVILSVSSNKFKPTFTFGPLQLEIRCWDSARPACAPSVESIERASKNCCSRHLLRLDAWKPYPK